MMIFYVSVFFNILLHLAKSLDLIDSVDQSRLLASTSTNCNLTAYAIWKQQTYTGVLAPDPSFWRYQIQTEFVLTNELATTLAVADCKNEFSNLYQFKAGRNGPITIPYCYDVMCSTYCLESDNLHNTAMSISGCSCLELSTQSTDPSYHIEGDFCNDNSARLLCKLVGYCGVWNCRLDDFMCPRYEFNKKTIVLRGPGNCSSAYRISYNLVSLMMLILITTIGLTINLHL